MIIYNVTISLDPQIEDVWLNYMKNEHIPDVMATGSFSDYKLCRVLTDPQEGGINYAVQYFCESLTVLEDYQERHAPALQKEHTDKFGDKFIAIRTLLEVLD